MVTLSPRPERGEAIGGPGRPRRLGSLLALVLLVGCESRAARDPLQLRLGYFPNVTHLVPLSAHERGTFDRAVAPAVIEWKPLSSGPQAVEAMLAGALDACYLGPGPAISGYLRSRGEALVVLAGAASGGASLVVRRAAGVKEPGDLHGKMLAVPQLGNTQDLALRGWLGAQGLKPRELGGDVLVLPLAGSEMMVLFRRGELDGAWVPEPWATRLVMEAGGEQLVDERALWPDGRFATTVLVGSRAAVAIKARALAALVAAHVAEVEFVASHRDEARRLVGAAMVKVNGGQLPPEVLAKAFANVEPTFDPMPAVLAKMAEEGRRLGYFPAGAVEGLVDRRLLDAALAARRGGGER